MTLWRSELRRKHLQNVFDKLDQDQKDLIINLSEDQKLSPFWFAAVGNMMSYLDNSEEVFLNFLNMARAIGWSPYLLYPGQWAIRKRIDLPDDYYKSDEIDYAIHDYEGIVIAIKELEKWVKKIPSAHESFTIVDGNKESLKYYDEWQVKPKQNAVFEVKIDESV